MILLGSFMVMHRVARNLSHLACRFPVEVKQGNAPSSGFISHTVNKCPFHDVFNANFFHFSVCCFAFFGDFSV